MVRSPLEYRGIKKVRVRGLPKLQNARYWLVGLLIVTLLSSIIGGLVVWSFRHEIGKWADANHDALEALAPLGSLIFSGVLTFSTIGLWIVTGIASYAAKKSADIAEKTLYATQRAYVSVKPRWSVALDKLGGSIVRVGFWMAQENQGGDSRCIYGKSSQRNFIPKAR